MTIAAAYLTSEGVVLGTDSTTTITVPADRPEAKRVGQLLNHAQKLFEVGRPGRSTIAIATWGQASVQRLSHRTVAARVGDRRPETVAAATELLIEAIARELGTQSERLQGRLGYFVGGIDRGTREPRCTRLEFAAGQPASRTDLAVGDAMFEGQYDFFTRVFWGHDRKYTEILKDQLRASLPQVPADFDRLFGVAHTHARNQVRLNGHRDIPIREALDFVYMLLHITIKSMKFRIAPPTCGGPIELGFVTTDRPWRWVFHKEFRSAIREQGGTDAD